MQNDVSKSNLSTLNDYQKSYLTQISYVNITKEGREKIKNGGLTISELIPYIYEPDKLFNGTAGINEQVVEVMYKSTMGKDNYVSKKDVIQNLIDCGLGDLKLTDICSKNSGFQAMTFEDSFGNTGISYRGSDFEEKQNFLNDWIFADALEYFSNDSQQRKEALEYFDSHKNNNGNNYLYGHSLGGNLTEHTLVEKYEEIKQAYTVNANPINQKLLDTPEKIAVFNDPEKFRCNVISGDIVGLLKSAELYKDNINYVKNNEVMPISFVSAHLVQSATFDENGNVITITEKEVEEQLGKTNNFIINTTQEIREALNKVEENIGHIINLEQFSTYRDYINRCLQMYIDRIGYRNEYNEYLLNEFHKSSLIAEQTFINNIVNYSVSNTMGGLSK